MDWLQWSKEAGIYISPLLMGALIWMDIERRRLLKEIQAKDAKVESLAERLVTVATQLQTYLFNERKS